MCTSSTTVTKSFCFNKRKQKQQTWPERSPENTEIFTTHPDVRADRSVRQETKPDKPSHLSSKRFYCFSLVFFI